MVSINVFEHPVLGRAVSGREIYSLIGNSKSANDLFSDWFRDKQKKLLLEEGKDFIQEKANIPGRNRAAFEFILSIAAAKKVASAQAAQRGAGVVSFLREYERQLAEGKTNEYAQRISESSLKTTLTLPGMDTLTTDLPKEISNQVSGEPQRLSQIINLGNPVVPATSVPATTIVPLTPLQQAVQQLQQVADKEALAYDQSAEIARHKEQIESLVRCMGTVGNLFRQIATALLGELPVGELPIEASTDDDFDEGAFLVGSTSAVNLGNNSTRSKLIQLVNRYSEAKQVEQKDIWNYLYGQLNIVHHFSAKRHRSANKEPYLDVVERSGNLDKLYNLANLRLLAPVAASAQS